MWVRAALATMRLDRGFDVVAMPGNVMLFCRAEVRAAIVANLAAHLEPGGRLIAGFGLEPGPDAITLQEYDQACANAGLVLDDRFATWERAPYTAGPYAVTVSRRT